MSSISITKYISSISPHFHPKYAVRARGPTVGRQAGRLLDTRLKTYVKTSDSGRTKLEKSDVRFKQFASKLKTINVVPGSLIIGRKHTVDIGLAKFTVIPDFEAINEDGDSVYIEVKLTQYKSGAYQTILESRCSNYANISYGTNPSLPNTILNHFKLQVGITKFFKENKGKRPNHYIFIFTHDILVVKSVEYDEIKEYWYTKSTATTGYINHLKLGTDMKIPNGRLFQAGNRLGYFTQASTRKLYIVSNIMGTAIAPDEAFKEVVDKYNATAVYGTIEGRERTRSKPSKYHFSPSTYHSPA